MNMSDDCVAALAWLYKVTCVTALSEMVGMDGTPNDNQLDASIEAGVRAVAEAVGKGLAPASPRAVPDARIVDLAERLVAPGPKAAHVSASECHEISEFILSLAAPPIDAPDSKP